MDEQPPRIRFLLGGVQKAGTTALAQLLAQHPAIALPDALPANVRALPGGDLLAAWRKEAHVFDAPDFDDRWSVADVDARFRARFEAFDDGRLHGDATPVTVYHPAVVERVRRYNPAMRWIVLLRDPVERAMSHYFQQRARGTESRSLLGAILAESARLRAAAGDMSRNAAWRHASYVDRGRYSRQLAWLHRHFPREQVLLLRSRDLAVAPLDTAARALAFLGVAGMPLQPPPRRVLEGGYAPLPDWRPERWLLRWKLRGEVARLRADYGIDLGAR
jgi:hypothetical protein